MERLEAPSNGQLQERLTAPALGSARSRSEEPAFLPWRLRVLRALPLILILAAGTAVNASWVMQWRVGLPFDIDESGYLFRAFRDADYIRTGGLPSLIAHIVHPPGIQAPLLPVLAGIIQFLTNARPVDLIFLQEFFYCALVIATYSIIRRQAGILWGLVGAGIAAATPGTLVWARDFAFALPAAACVAVTLAVQLRAGNFQSRRRCILWGAILGLSTLARTMVLGIVPALVVAALVRRITDSPSDFWPLHRVRWHDRTTNLLLGLLTGGAVAATWYVGSIRGVLQYLTGYGFGAQAAAYGPQRSLLSFSWWLSVFNLLANTEFYLPITLALLLCVLAGAATMLWRSAHRSAGAPQNACPSERTRSSFLKSDTCSVLIFLVLAYLALSSTRNQGSGFELLLVPATISVVVVAASRAARSLRPALLLSLLLAAGLSFADQAAVLPGGINDLTLVSAGPINAVAFNGRGNLFNYASAMFGGCPTIVTCVRAGSRATAKSVVESWKRPSVQAAILMHRIAEHANREPVALFAVQDPLFNVNSVALNAISRYRQSWPIGVVSAPTVVSAPYREQLVSPRFGQPNFVITGPLATTPFAAAFSPLQSDRGVIDALRSTGFRVVGRIKLPDGRVMSFWWHGGRGPSVGKD